MPYEQEEKFSLPITRTEARSLFQATLGEEKKSSRTRLVISPTDAWLENTGTHAPIVAGLVRIMYPDMPAENIKENYSARFDYDVTEIRDQNLFRNYLGHVKEIQVKDMSSSDARQRMGEIVTEFDLGSQVGKHLTDILMQQSRGTREL